MGLPRRTVLAWSSTAELWLHDGEAGWHFVTLPAEVAEQVRAEAGEPRGFGSVRVEVTIGGSTWRTSVFPDTKTGSFVLPVKAEVRRREDLLAGDDVRVGPALRDC